MLVFACNDFQLRDFSKNVEHFGRKLISLHFSSSLWFTYLPRQVLSSETHVWWIIQVRINFFYVLPPFLLASEFLDVSWKWKIKSLKNFILAHEAFLLLHKNVFRKFSDVWLKTSRFAKCKEEILLRKRFVKAEIFLHFNLPSSAKLWRWSN